MINDNFVWDFWYFYDIKTKIFHLFYLNAPKKFRENNQHHFHSKVGYCKTSDFKKFENISDNVFSASDDGWDNTSIWSGCIIYHQGLFKMFYTSRTQEEDDGLTQKIGLATSHNLIDWKRLKMPVSVADPLWYKTKTDKNSSVIHAWRDPFVFQSKEDGKYYMLVTAQSIKYKPGFNGCIALLQAQNDTLISWKTLEPLFDTGRFAEVELPQIIQDKDKDSEVYFNCWEKYDSEIDLNKGGGLYQFNIKKLINTEKENYCRTVSISRKGYGLRKIKELNNIIVGFDDIEGGIKIFE